MIKEERKIAKKEMKVIHNKENTEAERRSCEER